MEEWLHFAETLAKFILRSSGGTGSVLRGHTKEMWELLRRGMLYYLRADPLPGVADNLEDAHAALTQYAQMVEEHFPPAMCTYLLHIAICRLPDQERQWGKVCYSTEFWVEFMIQMAKKMLVDRSIRDVPTVLANTLLIQEALRGCKAKNPQVKTFDEFVPEYRSQDHKGNNLDAGDTCMRGNQCLGSGVLLRGPAREEVLQALDAAIEQFKAAQIYLRPWCAKGKLESAVLHQYTRAQTLYNEIVHSKAYQKPTSKVSFNVISICHNYGAVCRGFQGGRD